MLIDDILLRCAEESVQLSLDGQELEVSFDDDISEELLSLLRANKPQLINYLLDHSGERQLFMTQPIHAVDASASHPLSFSQQRLWFIEQLEGASAHYNLYAAFNFQGLLNVEVATKAINTIISRHRVLLAKFSSEVGVPKQTNSAEFSFSFQEHNFVGQQNALELAEQAMQQFVQHPFSISDELLLSGFVATIDEGKGILAFNMHHIVTDGWSLGLFVKEFAALYESGLKAQEAVLPDLPIQYIDFAAWQAEHMSADSLESQLFYWQRQLANLPELHQLPLDRPRPAEQDVAGEIVNLPLSKTLTDRLNALAASEQVTPFMLFHAAFSVLLARISHDSDVVIGTPVANRRRPELQNLIGFFVNTLVLRLGVSGKFTQLLNEAKNVNLQALENQDIPFEMLVERLAPERTSAYTPLFQVMIAMNNTESVAVELPELALEPISKKECFSRYDLTLNIRENAEQGVVLEFEYAKALFDAATIQSLADSFECLLNGIVEAPNTEVSLLPLVTPAQETFLRKHLDGEAATFGEESTLSALLLSQAQMSPNERAVTFDKHSLTFSELDSRANQYARFLQAQGVVVGDTVAIAMARSVEMVVCLLAIHKVGAAYIPLDPQYPAERLNYMLVDSQCVWTLVDTQRTLAKLEPRGTTWVVADAEVQSTIAQYSKEPLDIYPKATDLAYIIYTSGSTGRPKGVQISHANVLTFLQAMKSRLQAGANEKGKRVWLALTSISFDISVLEIFGALANGFEVVIAPERDLTQGDINIAKSLNFSLFYFGNDLHDQDVYRLMLDGAKFADSNGFSAVWTPERHFSDFGGIYPNPAVTGAALAAITENVEIRAGSCVLPLHDPVEIAESWSVVDNLSNGRVGLAFASGWNPNDFALAPDAYQQRYQLLDDGIETFKALWAGETIKRCNGVGESFDVRIHPSPVQAKPNIWMTAAGNPETFRKAGEQGLNLLTHMLGQTYGELEQKIQVYREAWKAAGHVGEGKVTLCLHTFVGETEEQTLQTVKGPFKRYLATSLNLLNSVRSEGQELDEEQVLEVAFNRYYKTATLFGTPERCAEIVQSVSALDVDEITCLVDFGVPTQEALDSLKRLASVKDRLRVSSNEEVTVEQLIAQHGVTHMQCTPSWLSNWLASLPKEHQLPSLNSLFVGGEAFAASLRESIAEHTSNVDVWNMYGPTEATVWSSCKQIERDGVIALGEPLAGYRFYIVDKNLQPIPPGVEGELLISGAGLSSGYYHRKGLTSERFLANGFTTDESYESVYRTGDRVKLTTSGELVFAGRMDHQVKLRGYRIELGEIETRIEELSYIQQCAVVIKKTTAGDDQLVAYVTEAEKQDNVESLINQSLSEWLPAYMVPDIIIVLPALPKTNNGKIDRNALPDPQHTNASVVYVAPETQIEQQLADIWADLLKIDVGDIGLESSFFDLGGHSLLLMRLVGQIQEKLGLTLTVRDTFEAGKLKELAAVVERAKAVNAESEKYQQLTQPNSATNSDDEVFTI